MRRVLQLFSVFVFTLLVISSFVYSGSPIVREANAGDEHNVRGWIWGSNTGWISMNCLNEETCGVSNYGVNIDQDTGIMSGYAWNNPYDDFSGTNNIGWLSFNQADLVGCPEGECVARRVGDTLEGWARFLGGEDPNGGEIDEDDIYGEWGAEYNAPANTDTTPPDGDINNEYICEDGENGTYNDVELVSAGGGAPNVGWTSVAPIPHPRTNTVTEAVGGKVYVITGHEGNNGGTNNRRNEVYDPESNSWSANPQAPTALDIEVAAGAVNGNDIHIIGGYDDDLGVNGSVNRHWKYNTVSQTYTQLANLPAPRHGGGAATINGKIYFVGGTEHQPFADELFIYNIGTNSWSSGPNIPTATTDGEVNAVNGKLYVIGGFGVPFVQIYDPSTNSWSSGSNVPAGAQWPYVAGSGVVGDKIYIFGGEEANSDNSSNDTWEYDTVSDSWQVKDDMPASREFLGGTAAGCKLYAVSGEVNPGSVWNRQPNVYEYTTDECQGDPATYRDREVQCISEEAPDSSSGWDGWMKLKGTAVNGAPYGVTIDAEDSFEESYSWADDVVGWVDWGPAWIDTEDPQFALSVTKRGLGTGTVSSVPVGINCGADCSETYDEGTSVDLTAVADAGSSFEDYSGCTETGPNTCNTVMTQNRSVRALFVQNENSDSLCTDGLDNDEDGLIDNGGEIQPGDLNQDGTINVADVLIVTGMNNSSEPVSTYRNIAGDVHPDGVGDGDVDADDANYLNLVAVGLEPWPDPRSVGPDPECTEELPVEYELTTGVLDPEIGRRIAISTDQDGDGVYSFYGNCLQAICDPFVFSEGTPIRLSAIGSVFDLWIEQGSSLCSDVNSPVCYFTLDSDTFIRGKYEGAQGEICDNGEDDDGDGAIDAADSDCPSDPEPPVEICENGEDDDGDGLVDYEDTDDCPSEPDPDCPDCGSDDEDGIPEVFIWLRELDDGVPSRRVAVTEVGVGFRGDCFDDSAHPCIFTFENGDQVSLSALGDFFENWAGNECNGHVGSICDFTMNATDVHVTAYYGEGEEPPGEICDNGEDDDGDGDVDAADSDCALSCPAGGPSVCPACNDGIDNESNGQGDGFVDWNGGPNGEPADPACSNNPFLDSEGGLDNIEEI